MNVKVISRNVGLALLVSALFMFISMLVSLSDGRDSAFGPLAISFIITFIFGAFPFIFVRQSSAISQQDGFLIMMLSWLLSFIFGMLPYVLWGGEFSLVNAWFESVSGYTTTGSTILTDVEALPRSLLFWRSSTHFIGGFGVVVFLLLVLPDASPFRLRLANIELSSLSRIGYRYRSMRIVYIITAVYLGITVVTTVCLMIAGMSFFDAINHAFSIVATGGFSTKNMSLAEFDSVAINVVSMVFMIISSLHFGLIFTVVASHSFKPLFKTPVVKLFLGSIAVLSVALMLVLMMQGDYHDWGKAALESIYQVVSYMTTTGFGMSDNAAWPALAGMILMFAVLLGGCSGSTAGGIKADRIYIALKTLSRQIKYSIHPTAVRQIKIGNHSVSDAEASSVMMYIVLYCLILAAGIFLVLLCGVEPSEAVSGFITSMANAGPGVDSISALGTYAAQPASAKFIYTLGMIFGRVEIYPVIAVIYMMFRRNV